jgi:hypothetical protein
LAQPQKQKRIKKQDAAQLLFLSYLMQVSPVTMSHPSPRTIAPSPCLSLDIKDSLKEDMRFLDVGSFLMESFLAKKKLLEGGLLKGGFLKEVLLKENC